MPNIERGPPVASSEQGISVQLLVLESGSDTPIPDAQIFLDSEYQNRWLGNTDANGRLFASVSTAETYIFRASANTHASGVTFVVDQVPSEVIIHLSLGASLHGLVCDVDGHSVGPGAKVAAWPVDEALRRTDLESWLATGVAAMPFATTDELGEFTMTGLNSTQTYLVCAGWNGSLSEIQAAKPSAEALVITVLPVYGLIARIRTIGPTIPSHSIPFPGFIFTKNASLTGRKLDNNDPRLLLGGISIEGIVQDGRFDQVYMACTSAPEQAILPIGLSGNIPGYEQFKYELQPSRCEKGLKEYPITLTPTTRDWADLSIEFLGATNSNATISHNVVPLAVFILNDNAGRHYDYPIQDFSSSLELPGLPYGAYSYNLRLDSGFGTGNYAEGQLVLDTPTESLQVDVGGLAVAMMEIKSSTGIPFMGRTQIKVSRIVDGRSTMLSFARPPYLVQGLPSDSSYLAEVVRPRPSEGRKHSTAEFTVSPAQIATVHLELDLK